MSNGILKRVYVLSKTDSTQDAARRIRAAPGDVVVTARQTHGRGRLGRAWADTESGGIAMTIVLDKGEPERLAIATAVATALAAESILKRTVGIKWPNDIFVDGRKLAGILIEQQDDRAYIGIGLNVGQRTWPADLSTRAVSMAELGVLTSRAQVMAAILREVNSVLQWSSDDLVEAFKVRDALTGQSITCQSGDETITGVVKAIDPMRGIVIAADTDGQDRYLPAATTTVLKS